MAGFQLWCLLFCVSSLRLPGDQFAFLLLCSKSQPARLKLSCVCMCASTLSMPGCQLSCLRMCASTLSMPGCQLSCLHVCFNSQHARLSIVVSADVFSYSHQARLTIGEFACVLHLSAFPAENFLSSEVCVSPTPSRVTIFVF